MEEFEWKWCWERGIVPIRDIANSRKFSLKLILIKNNLGKKLWNLNFIWKHSGFEKEYKIIKRYSLF